ncbi:cadherin repeat domain-containing protein [Aequorivita sp. H23M31]|uniref:Cadherin repeat domain-containing protein n=1 Tax=Aequorivita ciconiae TaxID=2494375 RepID=A0A410G0H8_9FLAO|nr:cadherin repeat domain-containing protein [Aequorivita sp. H23M31]QAA80786.1 cadherin repeat domain-containing protein [Aequorivita sp. H23M31]
MRISFNYCLSLLLLISVLTLNSCSKDDETETTVTTSDFSTIMDEYPPNGELIGTVEGRTNRGSVTFSILEQTPMGAFSIDAISGELKVADETLFVYGINPIITGTVKVANGDISKNAAVTITLNDLTHENIYNGDVILRTQGEVNSFGSAQYTRITGYLTIGDPADISVSDISDLSPLETLNRIDLDLNIMNNANLVTTTGLEIAVLEGSLLVFNNPELKKLEGFSGLTSLGDLFFSTNDSLDDLSSLSNLSVIESDLIIVTCGAITNLDWLNHLTSVANMSIRNCMSLAHIDGLNNLRNLNGEYNFFEISDNSSLKNLNGLINLRAELYELEVGHNPSLESIQGLENINVTHILAIEDNQVLENLNGLESTISIAEKLIINDNYSLTNLQGLGDLTSAYEIHLYRNGGLLNLEGLNNLADTWKMDIQGNSQLSDYCSLLNLFSTNPPTVFLTGYNAYNPTRQDLIDGNCSL